MRLMLFCIWTTGRALKLNECQHESKIVSKVSFLYSSVSETINLYCLKELEWRLQMQRAIVTVARFTADYIRAIPIPSGTGADGYNLRCQVFNRALQLFKKPAATQPMVNREFNWRAQKFLLAMSDNLDKPLIINKASYRAVRQVMIGLKKAKTEKNDKQCVEWMSQTMEKTCKQIVHWAVDKHLLHAWVLEYSIIYAQISKFFISVH